LIFLGQAIRIGQVLIRNMHKKAIHGLNWSLGRASRIESWVKLLSVGYTFHYNSPRAHGAKSWVIDQEAYG